MKESAIFFINSLQNGGAERVVQNQVAELCRRNVEVYVFTIHDKTFYSLPDSSKEIVLFKNVKGIRKVLSLPVIAFKLDKYIKKIKSNSTVILMTAHLPYAHNVMKFSKYSNEFLYVMHNPQFRFKNSGSFFFKMKFNFFYKRKKLVGVTQGITEELIKNYKCEKKYVTTIYNPIDFKNIDKSLQQDTTNLIITDPYILFVGRLNREKNLSRLIKAYLLNGFYKNYKLVVLGTGDMEKELRTYVQSIDMDNYILFFGWEKNVYKWMKNAEMLVCSSDYESFGMTIVEALYNECKVVSTDCLYGPREIMIGSLQNFLSELNENDLALKMNLAITDYPKINKDDLKRFDVSIIINQYLTLYYSNLQN